MTKELILYTKEKCSLCDDAKILLETILHNYDVVIREKDIYKDDDLLEKYQLMIPVVEIDGEEIDYGQIDPTKVMKRLQ
ncbi:glutaredoxin family protein [Pontibacillus sp. HMF3514]|uniref:glutaredoxin family protein n=1 Tax=Pontibacillus sp. HMF3514 TaxID=2692425 RepID=UPI00131FA5F4|nr:glutaredoxin family protein [Pontibacillus sp. HMF3514]QHE53527.1 glutaredoxin family protein [Pontibacillus sp. HMF3514]